MRLLIFLMVLLPAAVYAQPAADCSCSDLSVSKAASENHYIYKLKDSIFTGTCMDRGQYIWIKHIKRGVLISITEHFTDGLKRKSIYDGHIVIREEGRSSDGTLVMLMVKTGGQWVTESFFPSGNLKSRKIEKKRSCGNCQKTRRQLKEYTKGGNLRALSYSWVTWWKGRGSKRRVKTLILKSEGKIKFRYRKDTMYLKGAA